MSSRQRIERLDLGEGERLRAIRLRALQEAPDAFETTFAQAEAWPPERWDQQLKELATFVASSDVGDVGMVRGARQDELQNAGYLISMWVAPEARRQGLGSALVDAVASWARNERLTRLFLDVGEENKPAFALYTSKGFVPTGEVRNMPPPREHVRELQLVMSL